MAAELAKVSLWLEALEPGKPLSFLDQNIRVGNSLLGVTPALLEEGLPDAAFAPIEGDDRKVTAALKKQNAAERSGQHDLFRPGGIPVSNASLAKRAYRRNVSADDVNELFQYYQEGMREGGKDGGFEAGIRSAVTGVLASPFFLYRGEHVPAGLHPGETYAISDLELASKLSFFLWNSIPDDELLQLGIDGKLKEPSVLDRQVRRMLADPRSITLAANFVPQWLDMKRLDEIVPDAAVFPYA